MQPKALYLADVMEYWRVADMDMNVCDKAAAELRRLHAMNEKLLESLREVLKEVDANSTEARRKASAAIAKAEGK